MRDKNGVVLKGSDGKPLREVSLTSVLDKLTENVKTKEDAAKTMLEFERYLVNRQSLEMPEQAVFIKQEASSSTVRNISMSLIKLKRLMYFFEYSFGIGNFK